MSAQKGPPVLFADLDGTVRHGRDELGHFVNAPEDVVIFPEALAQMRVWREAGGVVVGVTNQGGVGLGYITHETHLAIVRATIAGCEGQLAETFSCTHRPDAGCWCRKPLPGLLFDARLWVELQGLGRPDRSTCLMVGDRPEDEQAAAAAGVPFQWAADWRVDR